MKANPVGWFEIYVQDMNRARRFYETVFQGKLEKLDSPGIENRDDLRHVVIQPQPRIEAESGRALAA